MSAGRTWTVVPASGEVISIDADRVELSPEQARATFFVGDDAVASFVGYTSLYPVPTQPTTSTPK